MTRVGDLFSVVYGDKRYESKGRLKKSPTGTQGERIKTSLSSPG